MAAAGRRSQHRSARTRTPWCSSSTSPAALFLAHDGALRLRRPRRPAPGLGRAGRQVEGAGRHRPVQVRRMEARPVRRSRPLQRLQRPCTSRADGYTGGKKPALVDEAALHVHSRRGAGQGGLLSARSTCCRTSTRRDVEELKALPGIQVVSQPDHGDLRPPVPDQRPAAARTCASARRSPSRSTRKQIVTAVVQRLVRAQQLGAAVGSPSTAPCRSRATSYDPQEAQQPADAKPATRASRSR